MSLFYFMSLCVNFDIGQIMSFMWFMWNVILYHVIYVIIRHFISCNFLSFNVTSCHIMSNHVMSCHIMSYYVLKSFYVICSCTFEAIFQKCRGGQELVLVCLTSPLALATALLSDQRHKVLLALIIDFEKGRTGHSAILK
jgi:hypothetical protein